MKRLGTDLTSAQKEMKAKHKAYENAVGILSRRLQETLTDKETAEAELVKLKAQVSEGGNSQALQVLYKPARLLQFQAIGISKSFIFREVSACYCVWALIHLQFLASENKAQYVCDYLCDSFYALYKH